MFGVGLHFSLDDLLAVKRIAIPGAVVQMTLATLLGMGLAWWWDWSWGAGLILGLSLSCASTVVLLKALEARGVLDTMNGRIAVGWLVVEDLVTVLVLVLLPPLAGVLGGAVAVEGAALLWRTIAQTLLGVAAFIVLMLVVGRSPRAALAVVASSAHRIAGIVHTGRHRNRNWYCLRRIRVFQCVVCSGCVLCGYGDARIRIQPPCSTRIVAAA